MSVLLRKEIRSLLPAWVLTMAATALTAFVRPNGFSPMLLLVAAGSLIVGITSFGSEFSHGTFSLLLAQPIPRHKIWRTKTIVLGAALLSIAIMVWFSFICAVVRSAADIRDVRAISAEDLGVPVIFTLVLFGAAFAGGLFSALATRQMSTAFCIALLFPFAVSGIVVIFTMDRSEKAVDFFIAAALAVYDILAFLLARRQFLRAQDLPGAASTIVSLPGWMRLGAEARGTRTAPLHRPLRTLVAKEFQLHQVSVGVGVVLLVLHVIVLFVRRMIFVPGGTQKEIYEILGWWWLLWFVLPIVVAGTAVAEERRQGTLEGALCLPAGKGTQWFVKWAVCFVVAIFFGAVMPWLLEMAGQFIGLPAPVFEKPAPFGDEWHFLGWAVSIVAIVSLLTFYASSLSRGLLQAVGIAILAASVFNSIAAEVSIRNGYYNHSLLTFGDLLPFWLALFALVLWLSYVNFKQPAVGRALWLQNAFVLVLAAACAHVVIGYTQFFIM